MASTMRDCKAGAGKVKGKTADGQQLTVNGERRMRDSGTTLLGISGDTMRVRREKLGEFRGHDTHLLTIRAASGRLIHGKTGKGCGS